VPCGILIPFLGSDFCTLFGMRFRLGCYQAMFLSDYLLWPKSGMTFVFWIRVWFLSMGLDWRPCVPPFPVFFSPRFHRCFSPPIALTVSFNSSPFLRSGITSFLNSLFTLPPLFACTRRLGSKEPFLSLPGLYSSRWARACGARWRNFFRFDWPFRLLRGRVVGNDHFFVLAACL